MNIQNEDTSRDITRREAIRRGLAGAAGVMCLGGAGGTMHSWAESTQKLARPASWGKAKAVIQIWMWGGPAHVDSFDPKPEAGHDYCGSLDSPIATNVDGIRIGQLLPEMAKVTDKYSIIRSMTHGNNGHETASYIVQTGRHPGRLVYPTAGAVISRFKGYDHGYKGLIPPYVVLTSPQGRFSEAGFLGPKYKPFATGGDPNRDPFMVEGIVARGISRERQEARRKLLQQADTLGAMMVDCEEFQKLAACESKAYDMILGDAGKIFDLRSEDDAMREKYGRSTFGQSCLMARRLVENGVPYITINYKGWDTHKQHFQIMNQKMPELDQGLAALIEDLDQRGLLDSTIVWWSGEFGRTPKIQWEAPWNGGRGHFGPVFSSVVAGGGFTGGTVVGATDKVGAEVAERPVHPADLISTVYMLMGIDPDGPLPNPMGLDLKVMEPPSEEDLGKNAVMGEGPLREII